MPITLDIVPEPLRKRIGPESPEAARMMMARAVLPMPPADLFAALAYLAAVSTGELQATAKKSLLDMPRPVLEGLLKAGKNPDILEFALHLFIDDDKLAQLLVLNSLTPDVAVEWAARRVRGELLEVIGNNQERLVRHAGLAEAIYFNTAAPMSLVTRVFETAVRNGVDLSHISGYREIYESIFGREAAKKLEKAHEEPLPVEPEEPEDPEEKIEADKTDTPPPVIPPPGSDESEIDDKPGIDDDLFQAVLKIATTDDAKLDPEKAEGEAESKRIGQKPMNVLIEEMNVPQKVRMALVGNKTARAILIKDSMLVVSLAVLRSPQVTEGEIALYCKNKSLSDRIITVICRNRDWTRATSVQLSLIKHPKTPPTFTNRWVRSLPPKDLKDLSKSREVPGHVARLAKNLIQQRENKKGGGR